MIILLKKEATYWFRFALKFYEKNDPSNIDKCLVYLALFCKSSSQVKFCFHY